MKKFLRDVLDPTSEASAKRFITIILAAHFVITSFLVSFFVFYLILFTPKGNVNKDLLETLKVIFEYDFYIILAGLGFITADNLGQMMLEKAKTITAGNVSVGAPTADNLNVTTAGTVNTDNIDTVNTKTVINSEPTDAK